MFVTHCFIVRSICTSNLQKAVHFELLFGFFYLFA